MFKVEKTWSTWCVPVYDTSVVTESFSHFPVEKTCSSETVCRPFDTADRWNLTAVQYCSSALLIIWMLCYDYYDMNADGLAWISTHSDNKHQICLDIWDTRKNQRDEMQTLKEPNESAKYTELLCGHIFMRSCGACQLCVLEKLRRLQWNAFAHVESIKSLLLIWRDMKRLKDRVDSAMTEGTGNLRFNTVYLLLNHMKVTTIINEVVYITMHISWGIRERRYECFMNV